MDLEVAAELPENLTAGAARRRRRFGVGDDRDAREDAVAFRQRLEHRDALGADRQAVGRVLDVAAGDDRAVAGLERRADLEVREGGVGVLAGAARGGDQIDLAAAIADAARPEPAVLAAPVAFGAADVLDAAIEPGAAIGLDAGAAIVEQQPHPVGLADAVDDVGDAGDLIELRGQRWTSGSRWQRSAAVASVQ